MPKECKIFDLEDRLINSAFRIVPIAEALPKTYEIGVKTARQKSHKTSYFEIPCSVFDIHILLNQVDCLSERLWGTGPPKGGFTIFRSPPEADL